MAPVRVIYVPPPNGPKSTLSMGHGLRIGQESRFTLWLARKPEGLVLTCGVALALAIAAIPVWVFPGELPPTMTPEYEASTRAYMRYHNMNPIWGISSKKARARDGEL